MIVADDAPLANALVWSLPAEQIDGFILFGGLALARLRRSPGCRAHRSVDLSDRQGGLDALRALVRQRDGAPILAIAADDAGCDFLAGATLDGLMVAPVPNAETLRRLRDKWSFQQLCETLGAPTPPTRRYANKGEIDIDQCLARHDGAVVIKPLNQKGGMGVVIVSSAEDFRRRVLDDPTYDYAPLIVQAFVAGVDLDISVLASEGVILHRAIQVNEGPTLRFLDHPALTREVEALVRHTGLSGFAHFDARWTPDGEIALLECNVRPWATISKSTWCGLNFIRAAVDVAQGRPPGEPASLTAGVALRPDAWALSAVFRPWRWLALNRDQRRILFGGLVAFVGMDMRGQWLRFAGLFGAGRDR